VTEALQTECSVVLITGSSGIGKTSLIRYIAERCLNNDGSIPQFDSVVWLNDRNSPRTTTLDSVFNKIAYAFHYLGIAQSKDFEEKHEKVNTLVSTQRILLVVDNFETVNDKTLVRWLLGLPNRSKAIVIRCDFHKDFEDCPHVRLHRMSEGEALAFAKQRLQFLEARGQEWDISDFKPLVAATGGNPHAIALALGQINYRPLNDIVEEIENAQGEIFERLLYPQNWHFLNPKAKQVLMAATLFPVSVSRQALSETARVEGYAFDAGLRQLINLALLNRDSTSLNPLRYTMHPLVRSFARGKLKARKKWALATHKRWLEWAATFSSKSLNSQIDSKTNWPWNDLSKLDILESEEENIYAAISWAAQHQEDDEINKIIIRIAYGVDHYYYVRGLWDKKQRVDLMRIKASHNLKYEEEEARSLAQYIQLLCRQGDTEKAKGYLQQLEVVKTKSNLSVDVAIQVQHAYAFYDMANHEFDTACQILEQCLEQSKRAESKPSQNLLIATQHWLATCLYRKGLLVNAERCFTEALEQADKAKYQRSMIYCRLNLGKISLEQSRLESADTFLRESLQEARSIRELRYIAQIQLTRVRLYIQKNDLVTANTAFSEAKELYDRLSLKDDYDLFLKMCAELKD
jgi:tetratricopeptide (TPR) repeat protein